MENHEQNLAQLCVELRTKFSGDYALACSAWVKKYSIQTHTDWIISQTDPNLTKMAFRKDFVCQHSKKNKSVNSSRLRNRNFNCSATLVVRVRKNTVDTRKRDALMKEGFNAIIKIEANHDHAVHVAEAYSYLRMSEETKTAFLTYFHQGLTPATSKIYHETCLIASASEEEDVTKMLADGHINPLDRSIYYLYDMWRSNHFGDRTKESMIEVIKNKKAYYDNNNVQLTVREEPSIVSVLTPLMNRAHQEIFSSEIIFVDSTGSCDQAGSCITFIFGACKIGAIPLGCVIHQSQNEECYREAFDTLKHTIGGTGFNGKFPAVIMTDDSVDERNALAATFPQSKLLLCSFHVCQAMWRWLWDSKHNIEKSDRKPLMLAFRQIVFEKDVTNTEELMNDFLNHDLLVKYPLFKEHIVGFWERKTEWCVCYRSSYLTRGHNTNNIVEASIRIFKDNVLQRCKAFNAVATIDFVSNQLEQHYVRRTRKYALSRVTKPELLHNKFCLKAKELQVRKLSDNTYNVTSTNEFYVYVVHTDIEMCDCPQGQGGAFCKHLCAVEMKENMYLKNSPTLTFDDRISLAKLAEGKDIDESFFETMTHSNNSQTDKDTNIETSALPIISNYNFFNEKMDFSVSNVPKDPPASENCEDEINKFENTIKNLTRIITSNQSSHMKKMLGLFNNKLNQIETPSDFFDFCMSVNKQPLFGGRKIKVQPTSISRRKGREGLSCGSRRIQSGRPSKTEVARRIKRTRNLSRNISQNQSNAKGHGSVH